ncbi:MAG TPA: C25 family cysteine peptidase [Bacteroidia bacterium]|nr:C25 family cysteine peptidase [Bacteroidia bacterium]
MKKLYAILITAVVLPNLLFAGQWIGINSNAPAAVKVDVVSSNQNETILSMQLKGYTQTMVSTPRGSAARITAPETTFLLQAGAPDISKIAASVIIPDYAKMKIDIISSSYVDYPNVSIAPSKGTLSRTVNPASVPYTYGDVYNQNSFFPGTLAQLQNPFIVRDFRGQTVWIYPFQYNPVTQLLRVYTNMELKISVENHNGQNVFNRNQSLTSVDKEFSYVYSSLFKNANSVLNYTPLTEEGTMLIISPASYINALSSFVEWKARRGLACEVVGVSTIGNNFTAIKTFINSYYGSHNLKYVLLVGDVQDIATPYMSGGASDPSYGYISGNDSYAEVIVGRFSAQSVNDVLTQVQRSIDYESNPTPGGTWYTKAVGMASDQGPGDDGEMDWEHDRNIRAGLVNYGYTVVDELYDGTHGVMDANGDPIANDLITSVNNGRGVINYTGHGWQNGCATTGFSSAEVPQLTNVGMLPFWWSVGCVHGEFDNGTCIAEDLLRANNSGEPTGMVATFMSSINQYWDEPMDAQDEFDSLLTFSYVNNAKFTYGGINVNGCMHMNMNYGTSGDDMTNTWHCFGDPSFVVRNAVPISLTATHDTIEPIGTAQLLVNCSLNDAIVTITKGSTILGSGVVQNNIVTLNFNPVMQIDTFDITATGFNCIPYQGKLYIVDPTSVNEQTASGINLTISPNPVSNMAILTFDLANSSRVNVYVTDAKGKVVQSVSDSKTLTSGKQQLEFSTSSYAKGTYFIHLVTGGKEHVIKMMK